MNSRLILLLSGVLLLTGCTSAIELTPVGQQVRIITAAGAVYCGKLGQTTVSVADNFGGVKRRDDIVQANLENLARNSAADMKGNAIVAASAVKEGKQTYDVYHCP